MNQGTHNYIEDDRNQHIKVFINGIFYNRNEACISVFDSGFLLGDGVWEGIRLLNGHLVFLEEHLERLFHGAEKLSIDIGYSREELTRLLKNTIKVNNMYNDVHIRLIISRGLKKTPYQHPNANIGGSSIVIIPEYKQVNKEISDYGISLVKVNTRRGSQDSQDPRLNTLSKYNCIAACIEANNMGADEGIMLDLNGNVSTCNSTNFFMIKKGRIYTSTGEYCLPGITRKSIINICIENKISIKENNFTIEQVHSADEAFVTGTFAGIIPVIKIDNVSISNGSRGEITHLLQDLYFNKLNQLYPKEK